jgi:hypothetical protein
MPETADSHDDEEDRRPGRPTTRKTDDQEDRRPGRPTTRKTGKEGRRPTTRTADTPRKAKAVQQPAQPPETADPTTTTADNHDSRRPGTADGRDRLNAPTEPGMPG